jgi:very-short-patch-repair endonuclease
LDNNYIPKKIQLYVEKLQRKATRAEAGIKKVLEVICEREGIPLSFQHPIELYPYRWTILDFLIDGRLNLELDGKHHQEDLTQIRRDRDRDYRLRSLGYKVIRASNQEVMDDPIRFSLNLIDAILKSRGRKRSITRDQLEEMLERKLLDYLGLPSLPSLLEGENKAYSPPHTQEGRDMHPLVEG